MYRSSPHICARNFLYRGASDVFCRADEHKQNDSCLAIRVVYRAGIVAL